VGENRWLTTFGLNLRPANDLGIPELLGFLLAGLLMAVTVAALAGIPLVDLTQKPRVLAGFGVLMVLFALAMFGVFRTPEKAGHRADR
jgi:thiol:disulfide interchange protein DsbD